MNGSAGIDVEIVEGDLRAFDHTWLAGIAAVCYLAGPLKRSDGRI